jgi:hypothetical protein
MRRKEASFRGAREREPGISQGNIKHPGPRLAAHPGMTKAEIQGYWL